MDLKTFIATCSMIFMAEMGDKTQLAVFGATAASQKPLSVFLGATVGLVLVTGLAVILGQLAGQLVPTKALRMMGGVVFIAVGLVMLFKSPA